MEIAKRLAEKGHSVTVFSSNAYDNHSNMDLGKKVIQDNLTVYYFKNWSRILGFFITPRLIWEFIQNYKTFDVVHLQSFRHFQDLVSYIMLSFFHKPYIITVRGAVLPEGGGILLKKFFNMILGKRILRNARFVVAISHLLKNEFLKIGVEEEKIKEIPNGIEFIPTEDKGFLKKKLKFENNSKVILFLGRIRWSKGLNVLIEAFKKLNDHNIHLVIAGPDFGYQNYCQNLVEKLNLKHNVHFIGPVSNLEKPKVLSDADMLVLPSFYEAFGTVILEAAASKLPIIMTSSCGLAHEFEENNAALIVETRNVNAHYNAMTHLLQSTEDAKLISERALKLSKKFDWEKIVKLHEEMYCELLKSV